MKSSLIIRCVLIGLAWCGVARAADDPQAVPTRPIPLSAEELKIWNDPRFKEQLIESYKSVTDLEPKVQPKEFEQLTKIFALIQDNKMDEARQMIEKHMTPASSGVFDFTLANIYFQDDKLGEAARWYQSAIKKHEKFRRAWRNLALIFIRQNDFRNAIPALTQVIKLGGNDAVIYGLLGYAYSSVDDNLPAESAYRMANLLDPGTMDWKLGLVRSFFKQERFADASAMCKHLIAADPTRADLWLLQANAFIGLNQPMQAAENYEIVDRLGKSTAASLNTLADIYINAELYGPAVKDYIRAMDLDKEGKPNRAIRAAKVLAARSATEETKQLLEHIETTFAAKLSDGERKDLLKLHARIAMAEGSGAGQARILEQIIELDPLDGDALILLGQYHAGIGLDEMAAAKAADADKDEKTAKAKGAIANDQFARAVFYYERAEGLEKFEADAKVRHAQLLVKQAKYADALPLLRRAQQINPRDNIEQYLKSIERVANVR